MKTIPLAVAGRWRATAIPGEGDLRAVRRLVQLHAREHVRRQMRPQQRERMRVDRDARPGEVGEHPLPRGQVRKVGRGGGRIERERELLVLLDRLRAEDEPELPQQVAPLAEEVAGAAAHERLELARVQPAVDKHSSASKVADISVRPVRVPLGDERLGVVLPHRAHVGEAHPHRARPFERPVERAAAWLRLTSGGRTSTPRRCASRTRLEGG